MTEAEHDEICDRYLAAHVSFYLNGGLEGRIENYGPEAFRKLKASWDDIPRLLKEVKTDG